jgi:8-oxo-dGTP pyrophosphatase MutT (NUDIX family)
MKNPTDNPWTLLSERVAYESPWIQVNHHEVLNPVGNPGTYSVVHFKKWAIGILPIDEEGYTWVVGQYRYPIAQYSWEIPEGGGDIDVEPVVSAQRELLEEAGLVAGKWELIQQMYLSNSATDELAFIFLATQLTQEKPEPEETEQLQIRKLHFNELYELVVKGEVLDSLTVAAVLKLRLLITEGKFNLPDSARKQ